MRHELNIDLIFPIKDEISAALMCLKAELLFEAGIIDADDNECRHRTRRRSPRPASKRGSLGKERYRTAAPKMEA